MSEKYPFHVLRRDGFPKGKKVLSMCLPQGQPRIRADAAVSFGITRRSGTGVFESTPHGAGFSYTPGRALYRPVRFFRTNEKNQYIKNTFVPLLWFASTQYCGLHSNS